MDLSPESNDAVHKAKNAAQAVEFARDAQIVAAVEASTVKTKELLTDALRDVFGENVNSGRFIDVTRIPLICQSIISIHADISELKDAIKWAVRLLGGTLATAVLLGVIKYLFHI